MLFKTSIPERTYRRMFDVVLPLYSRFHIPDDPSTPDTWAHHVRGESSEIDVVHSSKHFEMLDTEFREKSAEEENAKVQKILRDFMT